MLLGTGHLGGPVLDRLAASAAVDRIVAVGRDAARGNRRCNLARLVAMSGGRAADVVFCAADLERRGELAARVREVAPDLVLHTASLQTWWLADLLPAPQRARLGRIGYGPWLSLHLTLAVALMRELAEAGYEGAVFNAAYPDAVNVVLARLGMAPTGGLGNVDELVAKVRLGAAEVLGVAPERLVVHLVAHHALLRFAFAPASENESTTRGQASVADAPPFHLRVAFDGDDVTERIRADHILLRPCPLPPGSAWGAFSAATAVAFVEAWLAEEPSRQHCAGPTGLPGGYPVVVGGRKLVRDDVPGLAAVEAVAINERAQQFDGVAAIGDDGTIEMSAAAAAAMQDLLGFDCRRLRPSEAPERARELAERFRRFAAQHGVVLETR